MRVFDESAGCRMRLCWITFSLTSVLIATLTAGQQPTIHDDRLQLSLFASDPDIVTPIGLAVDPHDRIFVVESHTHSPPEDYPGPDADRIKILQDTDGDGAADQISVFAEGIHQAMNLAFSPQGDLYVVCAREVLRLVDKDDDGRCDGKEQVLRLDTPQRYAHNSLLSITFDRSGWMYIGRGNTGSDTYRLIGRDDSIVEGFGDGGNVIRCRADGTELTEYATGFWNPFDLKFDRCGRLLLVDNDPDARGPNRLLRVVPGGDYGYKSMFGGAGTHPFQGWDGSLPGTLPYIAGTGEAPSGLIDCRQSAFPSDYGTSVLVSIWNENSVERFEIDQATGQLASKSVWLKGDQNFRPVAMDFDSKGNLYISDWVLVDYPNHGRGRIWKVSNRSAGAMRSQNYFAPYVNSDDNRELQRIKSISQDALIAEVQTGSIQDPLCRHAAVMRLANASPADQNRCLDHNVDSRLLSLLAIKRSRPNDTDTILSLLNDPSAEIRRAAVVWAAETMDRSLEKHLDRCLDVSPVTAELFDSYLAAREVLSVEFVQAYRTRSVRKANQIPRRLDSTALLELANDRRLSPHVRAMAVKRFSARPTDEHTGSLAAMYKSSNDVLSAAAMEASTKLGLAKTHQDNLVEVARDQERSSHVRTHALAALASVDDFDSSQIARLTADSNGQVATQARRTLNLLQGKSGQPGTRPDTIQQWQVALAKGGDALLGKHVFYSPRVGCSKCHQMNGRGGTLGPSLMGLARSKSRHQIIDSILTPSAEFAPQYQAWMVLTKDGMVHRGLQLDHKANGAIVLTLDSGKSQFFRGNEIEAYRALPKSLMPDGLEQLMSLDEFRDLVAFLSTLQ